MSLSVSLSGDGALIAWLVGGAGVRVPRALGVVVKYTKLERGDVATSSLKAEWLRRQGGLVVS